MSDVDNKDPLTACGQLEIPEVIDRDLIEEVVANHISVLGAEFDLKSLRLADDTAQLIARSRIREVVRLDPAPLTIFERGVVLQHLLNIVFNSRGEDDCRLG